MRHSRDLAGAIASARLHSMVGGTTGKLTFRRAVAFGLALLVLYTAPLLGYRSGAMAASTVTGGTGQSLLCAPSGQIDASALQDVSDLLAQLRDDAPPVEPRHACDCPTCHLTGQPALDDGTHEIALFVRTLLRNGLPGATFVCQPLATGPPLGLRAPPKA